MLFIRKEMNFFALLDALQTENGLIELGLGALCVLAAYAIARRLFIHWFAITPSATTASCPIPASAWCCRCRPSCWWCW